MNKVVLRQVTDINWKIDPDKAVDVAIDVLKAVEVSEYIPFASPCPSSTEKRVKDLISGARSRLEVAKDVMALLRTPAADRCNFCTEYLNGGCRLFGDDWGQHRADCDSFNFRED